MPESKQPNQEPTPVNVPKGTNLKFKHYAVVAEASNFNSIVAIPCDGNSDWYQMLDNSALLYYYEICKGKSNSKFKPDEGTYGMDSCRIGIVSIRGLDALRAKIKAAGLYKSETAIDYKGLVTNNKVHGIRFLLKKAYDQDAIDALYKKETRRREDNLRVQHAKDLDPVLFRDATTLADQIHRLTRKDLDNCTKSTLGVQLNSTSELLLGEYLRLAVILEKCAEHSKAANADEVRDFRTEKSIEKLTNMQKSISDLIILLGIAHYVGGINIEKTVALGSRAERILKLINADLAQAKKAQVKKRD